MIFLEKLQKILFTLSLIGVLFPIKISAIFIALLLLTSIFITIKNRFKNEKTALNSSIVFAGFFLLFVIGLLYTEESTYGLKWVERNSVWILIPTLLAFSLKTSYKELFRILLNFSIVVHGVGLFLVVVAISNFIETNNVQVFFYNELTSSIDYHPVYLSFFLLFSLIIVIEGLRKKYLRLHLVLIISLVIFDSILLVLLSSKTMLVSLFLLFFVFILINYKKERKAVVISLFLFLSLAFLITQFSVTKNRINDSLLSSWDLLDKETFKYNDPFTGATLRLITWKFVIKKFIEKENILIGIGTGDAKRFINQVYIERNMDAGGYLNFNMHNQYLEYFIKFGLVGVLYFFGILFLFFRIAYRNKDLLFGLFLIIFSIFSLTESTLEVQKGIIFFILVNTLFFFHYSSHKKKVDE